MAAASTSFFKSSRIAGGAAECVPHSTLSSRWCGAIRPLLPSSRTRSSIKRFMRSISFDVVRPLRGSTVRPKRRSTTSPMPSSTRRRSRSGKASSRRFRAGCSSLLLFVGASESVIETNTTDCTTKKHKRAKRHKIYLCLFISCAFCVAGLEGEFEGETKGTRAANVVERVESAAGESGRLSEDGAEVQVVAGRIFEVGVIEEIERVGLKLHVRGFRETEFATQREVKLVEGKAAQAVAGKIALFESGW